MPYHSTRKKRVSRKRKVNRRRTKKGGASASVMDSINNSEGFSLRDIEEFVNTKSTNIDKKLEGLEGLERIVKNLLKQIDNGTRKKYFLGNTELLPEEKITRKRIRDIEERFIKDVHSSQPSGSEVMSISKSFKELDTIKNFIDTFSPEEPPADVLDAVATLFGEGVKPQPQPQPQPKESNDHKCRKRNCNIMGGYKKNSKRKSKKKNLKYIL